MGGQRLARSSRAMSGAMHAEDGFTLIEVIAASVIFVIVSTATLGLLINALRAVRDNADRVYAAGLARTEVENLRGIGAYGITPGLVSRTVTTPKGTFAINTTSQWVGINQTTSPCDVASGTVPGRDYVRVHVEVIGGRIGAAQSVDTIIQPRDTSDKVNTGSITAKVVDAVGAPVSGVTVSGIDLTGSGDRFTSLTGADGCVFAPQATASTQWQVSVSKAGYLTEAAGTDVKTGQVLVLANTRFLFDYAAASTVSVASGSAEYPLPGTMPFTLTSDPLGRAPQQVTSYPVTVTGLWPYPAGYQTWLGVCLDAAPGYGTAPRTSAASATTVAAPAGGATTSVLRGVEVLFRGLTAAAPISMTHAAEASGRCTSPLTYAVGSTGPLGRLKATLPYGSWTFSSPGAPNLVVVLDPSNPSQRVEWTVANLDGPSPSPSPSASGSPSPSTSASPTP